MAEMGIAALKAFPKASYIQLYRGDVLVGGVARLGGEGKEAFQLHPWMPPAKYDPDAFVAVCADG